MKHFFSIFTFLSVLSIYFADCSERKEQPVVMNNPLSFAELMRLTPEHYTSGVVQNNLDPTFIESTSLRFNEALSLTTRNKKDGDKVKAGLQIFRDLALRGHLSSMLEIGNFCYVRENFLLAMKWYVLAFQADWLSSGTHNAAALQSLLTLFEGKKSKKEPEVKRLHMNFTFFQTNHPIGKHKELKSLITLDALYDQNQIENYLPAEEKKLKSAWFCDYYNDHYATPEQLNCEGASCVKLMQYEKALRLFIKANHPVGFFNAGALYQEGKVGTIGGQPDYEKAASLFRQANSADAYCNLGVMTLQGFVGLKDDGQPDFEEAERLLHLSTTPLGHFNLGYMYHQGKIGSIDGKPDYERAAHCYIQAGNVPDALCNLGNLHRDGHIGLKDGKPDYIKAAVLYRKSQHPNALRNIGRLYRDGLCGKVNYETAAAFFRQANIPDSFSDLASLYADGKIGLKEGKPDRIEALRLYGLSKPPLSFLNMGILTLQGDKANFAQAFSYFEKSDHVKAIPIQLRLVSIYYSEVAHFFPSKNKTDAIAEVCKKLTAKLSSLETPDKEFCLGLLCFYQDKNYDQSLIHFSTALAHGETGAEMYVDIITKAKESIEDDSQDVTDQDHTEDDATSDINTKDEEPLSLLEDEPNEEDSSSSEITSNESPLPLLVSQPVMLTPSVIELPKTINAVMPKQYKPKAPISYKERVQRLLKKANKTFLGNFQPIAAIGKDDPEPILAPLEIKYLNTDVEKDFAGLPLKIQELLEYIEAKPHGIEGTGKPEVLKGKYKNKYKGCISRRIDDENRLVYKVIGPRKIIVLSCKGHYTKQ